MPAHNYDAGEVISMLVSEIMVKDVVTLNPDDTLLDAINKFSERNISGAPVIDKRTKMVVGILSETDIFNAVKRNFKEFRMVHISPELKMVGLSFEEVPSGKKAEEIVREIGGIKVYTMMTKNVITVSPYDDVKVVIEIMSQGKINRIPIVSEGKLVGIVTRGDIIKGMNKFMK